MCDACKLYLIYFMLTNNFNYFYIKNLMLLVLNIMHLLLTNLRYNYLVIITFYCYLILYIGKLLGVRCLNKCFLGF